MDFVDIAEIWRLCLPAQISHVFFWLHWVSRYRAKLSDAHQIVLVREWILVLVGPMRGYVRSHADPLGTCLRAEERRAVSLGYSLKDAIPVFFRERAH